MSQQSWAPITRAVTGAPEVTAEWLQGHKNELTIVDVREEDDFKETIDPSAPGVKNIGRIPGSENVPLTCFSASLKSFSKASPIIFVCRLGLRSGRVALECEKSYGFTKVAALKGGLLAWRSQGYALES